MKTYTVERSYRTDSGWWAIVSGQALPLRSDEELPEGASVVIRDGKAVRP